MEDMPLGRIAALVPEFAVKDLPLGRTLMMMMVLILFFQERQGIKIEGDTSGFYKNIYFI